MRRVRDVRELENPRIKSTGMFLTIKRDPVEPEPIGTIIAVPFVIVGYDADCDGSLMARLAACDSDGEPCSTILRSHGLYPDRDVVLESHDELVKMTKEEK